jgi:hypothetical protein
MGLLSFRDIDRISLHELGGRRGAGLDEPGELCTFDGGGNLGMPHGMVSSGEFLRHRRQEAEGERSEGISGVLGHGWIESVWNKLFDTM